MKKIFLLIILSLLTVNYSGQEFASKDKENPLSINAGILKAQMVSPKYRNAIYSTMETPDSIKIRVHITNGVFLSSSTIDVTLSRNETIIKTWNFQKLKFDMFLNLSVSDITFENTRSAPYTKDDNPYKFKIVVKENGAAKDSVSMELNKYPEPPTGVNEVRLDDDNNLLINGERKIIFGAYLFHYYKTWYSYLESIGINGFLEWGSYVDNNYHSDSTWSVMRSNGTSYSDLDKVRQNIINNRQKKQLLIYRTVDEPNSHDVTPQTVSAHYQIAKEEDPYHPAAIVIKAKDHPAQNYTYTGYTNCADIFMLDVYPIYLDGHVNDGDIGVVSENYNLLRNSDLGASDWELENIATFAIPQIFNQSHWRLPYNMESKNLFYQHIVGGARSFFPYSYEAADGYNSAWEFYGKRLIPEIKTLEKILYAKEDNSGITIIGKNVGRLAWSRRVKDNTEYIILVNTSSKWNMLYSGKKKIIDMDITFNVQGSNELEVIVGNITMPNTYTIEDGKIHVLLDGVDEASSGVLVLKRSTVVSVEKDEATFTPEKYYLGQNYPNPFNPVTKIKYSLPVVATHELPLQNVTLKVYDVLGKEIATLVNKKQKSGNYTVEFNAANLSSGIYFYKLQCGNFIETKKMVLMK